GTENVKTRSREPGCKFKKASSKRKALDPTPRKKVEPSAVLPTCILAEYRRRPLLKITTPSTRDQPRKRQGRVLLECPAKAPGRQNYGPLAMRYSIALFRKSCRKSCPNHAQH